MSGNSEASASAKAIREAAASWISRRDTGNWSEADQLAYDAWLAQSQAHLVAYLRAEAAWNRAGKLAALCSSESHSATAAAPQRFRPITAHIVAAVIVVSALSIGALDYFGMSNAKLYTTPIGGRETITLADGSQIALNTNTALRISLRGKKREIWFDKGEAYFQVTHDIARPFLVVAGTRRITDLGTEFSVRRDDERLEVAVIKGRVAFDDGRKSQAGSLALASGDVAVATKTDVSLTKRSSQALAASLSWRQGLLVFDNTTLSDAAKEFNRYNSERLVIADTAANLPIVGTFRSNDAESFARVARQVFGLLVKKRGEQIVISR